MFCKKWKKLAHERYQDMANYRRMYHRTMEELQSKIMENMRLLQHLSQLQEYQRQISSNQGQFSQEEIRKLISLCHPDKHDGKKSAIEMSQKLIKLRGK